MILVVGKRDEARPQGQQMTREVPAVHRRDIERRQRLQRSACRTSCRNAPRAVPCAAIVRKRIRRALEQLSGRDVAEVVGRQIRQQRKSHVRRRGAMRDGGDRMFLAVVRRQPVVVRTDERLEERPGPSRELPEEERLVPASAALRAERAAG